MTEPNATQTLYRCSSCGKWSHAKHPPKSHRRFIRDEGQAPPPDWIEREPPAYDHMNGFTREGGWWVSCGPFDKYKAVKVT